MCAVPLLLLAFSSSPRSRRRWSPQLLIPSAAGAVDLVCGRRHQSRLPRSSRGPGCECPQARSAAGRARGRGGLPRRASAVGKKMPRRASSAGRLFGVASAPAREGRA
ncbi:hypothetical protein BS78_08G103000 [Paspalum vaginatum]|nr:hypothetical protein BS78_08G103000 [Paspalum vaginatum]